MLKWFVSPGEADRAINDGELLLEDVIESRPEKVSNACIDDNINIFKIRKFFSADGWQLVKQVIEIKKLNTVYYCGVCEREMDGTVICCDSCLECFIYSVLG